MIGFLTGVVKHRSGTECVIDVNGVGYEVTVSSAVLDRLGGVGNRIELVISTDIKENGISLYGFSTFSEREVFLLLRRVKGIGAKLALGILSVLSPEELLEAIGAGNVAALSEVPGIGKRTAERVIVELRERVGEFARDVRPPGRLEARIEVERIVSGAAGGSRESALLPAARDALLALEKLGFNPDRARRAVTLAVEAGGEVSDAGEVLRLALSKIT